MTRQQWDIVIGILLVALTIWMVATYSVDTWWPFSVR